MDDKKTDHDHQPSQSSKTDMPTQKSPSQASKDFPNLAQNLKTDTQDPQVVENSVNNNCSLKAVQPDSNTSIIFQDLVEEVMDLDVHDPDFHISIGRDYSGKVNGDPMRIRFFIHFPIILAPLITREEFKNTVRGVNSCFQNAESGKCETALESILSCFTCTLINVCRKNLLDKAMDKLAIFLYHENDLVYHPVGLHVVHPMALGLQRIVIRSIGHYGLYKSVEPPPLE